MGSQGDKWLSPSDLQRETWLTDLSGDRVTLADLGALEVPHCKPHGEHTGAGLLGWEHFGECNHCSICTAQSSGLLPLDHFQGEAN